MGRLIIPDDGSGGSPIIIAPPAPPLLFDANAEDTRVLLGDGTVQGTITEAGASFFAGVWDGTYAWLATNDNPAKIYKYNGTTFAKVGGPYTFGYLGGAYPKNLLAFDGTNYWIRNGSGGVIKFDSGGNVLATIGITATVNGLWYDGAGHLLIPCGGTGYIAVINTTTNAVTHYNYGSDWPSFQPFGCCHGGYFYTVFNAGWFATKYLYKINPATGAIVTETVVSNWGPFVTDGTYYYWHQDYRWLHKVRMSDMGVEWTVDLTNVDAAPLYDGTWLWTSGSGSYYLRRIDPATGTVNYSLAPAYYNIAMLTTKAPLPWP